MSKKDTNKTQSEVTEITSSEQENIVGAPDLEAVVAAEEKKSSETLKGKVFSGVRCSNPKCITNHEEYLPKSFRSSGDETLLECEYCDERKLI